MNKIKHAYIILLSVLFMNNIISMEDQDYIASEQESQLLSLPAELMTGIINKTVIQQVKETINKWNDIFQEPKINLQNIALASQQFKDVLNTALKSTSLKNYIKDLKSKRFDELFEDLKIKSIEQYKGLSTQSLNGALFDILNKAVIFKKDLKEVVKLILAGADINTTNIAGETALMFASRDGHKEIVEMLIKAKADVDAKSIYGKTALMWASRDGHKDIVEILLQARADVNAKTIYGDTALIYASQYGQIVQMLIDKGTDVNAKDKFFGRTVLMKASEYGHKDIVQMLIDKGANVNAKDNDGNTALIYASKYGYTKIVQMLIDAGADVNAKNNNGFTALMLALRYDHKDIVEMLKKYERQDFYYCILS